MNYFEIKYALTKKGYTLTGLAYELGLAGPQSVQQVLTRKYRSVRVEKRVSEITGLPLEELFPDRYPRDKRQPRNNDENTSEKKL
jgi:lambda repressor-like predicted transcriptional regulator